MTHRYRIPTPPVELQILDDEAILIHFDSGAYFSANASGSRILGAIRAGTSIAAIGMALARRHALPIADATRDVEAFVRALLDEGLIAPARADDEANADPIGGTDPHAGDDETGDETAGIEPYAPPAIEKFTDLDDLLTADPIHEVDGAGWPMRDTGTPKR